MNRREFLILAAAGAATPAFANEEMKEDMFVEEFYSITCTYCISFYKQYHKEIKRAGSAFKEIHYYRNEVDVAAEYLIRNAPDPYQLKHELMMDDSWMHSQDPISSLSIKAGLGFAESSKLRQNLENIHRKYTYELISILNGRRVTGTPKFYMGYKVISWNEAAYFLETRG